MALTACLIPFVGMEVTDSPLPVPASIAVRVIVPSLAIGSAMMMAAIVASGNMPARVFSALAIVAAASVVTGYVWSYVTRDDPAAFGSALPILFGLPLLVLTSGFAWLASAAARVSPDSSAGMR